MPIILQARGGEAMVSIEEKIQIRARKLTRKREERYHNGADEGKPGEWYLTGHEQL